MSESSKWLGDRDLSLDALLVTIRDAAKQNNPNILDVRTCVIKRSGKNPKIATYWTIRDQHTGEPHHRALTLKTLSRKADGWHDEVIHSISLSDKTKEEDEIANLTTFLTTDPYIPSSGKYLVLDLENTDNASIESVLSALSGPKKSKIISELMILTDSDPELVESLVQVASQKPYESRAMVAALNYGRFTAAIQTLEEFIENDAPEKSFQQLLQENSWMFGSEYGRLLDRRSFVSEDEMDFLVQRTVDNYLELIEIKTPLNGVPLFLKDASHQNYYPRKELTVALSQVMKYISSTESVRDFIQAKYGWEVERIRAKLIIGRDVDTVQINELHRLNSHLHQIEIITFDQLKRTADRVLQAVSEKVQLNPDDDAYES